MSRIKIIQRPKAPNVGVTPLHIAAETGDVDTLYNVILSIARNLLETRENENEIFSRKFHRFVLGLVGLIDAKATKADQPIWL